MAQLNCIVVTPEDTALEQSTSFLVLPLFDGEKGIAPGHSPMIGRLGFGEMRLKNEDGSMSRFYIDGGFVQIADNSVSVLTGRAVPAGDLDAAAIAEQLEAAKARPSNSPELMEIRERVISQTRAQLRVAQK